MRKILPRVQKKILVMNTTLGSLSSPTVNTLGGLNFLIYLFWASELLYKKCLVRA
jgi:hypothetical protein